MKLNFINYSGSLVPNTVNELSYIKKEIDFNLFLYWCPHRDSNADQLLRKEIFYPLNYRDMDGE